MKRSLPLLLCGIAGAAEPEVQIPAQARQGDTIRIAASQKYSGGRVLWNGQNIPLFSQPGNSHLALIGVPANLEPGDHKVVVESTGGSYTGSIRIEDARFPVHNITVSRRTKALRPMPGEMKAVQSLKETTTGTRLWQEPFISPVPDCINYVFGVQRHHNGKPTGNYHKGVDLRSPRGRPIHAIADGEIVLSRMFRLHGGTVGLDHGQGLTSIYIHLSRLGPRAERRVKQGDIIGYVGATGFATGPHLHWQLFVHGTPVNPEQWVPNVAQCE